MDIPRYKGGRGMPKRIGIAAALKLLKDGKISLGKAAELCGLNYEEMRRLAIRRGLKPFIIKDEDLEV